MLLTPQSGPELRKQIKDFIDKQSEQHGEGRTYDHTADERCDDDSCVFHKA